MARSETSLAFEPGLYILWGTLNLPFFVGEKSMPKELEPQSLPQLKAREAKLQDSLAKADFVSITYTPGRFATRLEQAIEKTPEKVMSRYTDELVRSGEARLEADLRVDDIKKAIKNNATPNIEASLASTQAQIRLLDDAPRLVSLYKDYLGELKNAESYVARISERVQAGLDPNALERAQTHYKQVESRAADPEIASAKEVYMRSLIPPPGAKRIDYSTFWAASRDTIRTGSRTTTSF